MYSIKRIVTAGIVTVALGAWPGAAAAQSSSTAQPQGTSPQTGADSSSQQPSGRRLAASGLADEADRLALMNREGDVLDRRDLTRLHLVPHDELIDLQQRLGGVDLARFQVLQ